MKECPECGRCFDTAEERCPRDGRELIYTTPVERTVNEKYRLEVRIGQGGMGTVYEALDLRLNRKVAFKVMTGSLFGNLAAVRRFEREAKAAARLNHRNIVAIYDFGAIAGSGAYLVMELVEGRSLQSELQARGAVSTELAAELLDQLLAGMEAAHSAGVIHRDLKPENVLVAGRGDELTIKILDFGLAKLRAENAAPDSTQTVAGAVLGTLGYMAPEQVVGGTVDERSDIFALGVIVVRMLTGKLPFITSNYAEYMKSVCERDFQLPGDSGEERPVERGTSEIPCVGPGGSFSKRGDASRRTRPRNSRPSAAPAPGRLRRRRSNRNGIGPRRSAGGAPVRGAVQDPDGGVGSDQGKRTADHLRRNGIVVQVESDVDGFTRPDGRAVQRFQCPSLAPASDPRTLLDVEIRCRAARRNVHGGDRGDP